MSAPVFAKHGGATPDKATLFDATFVDDEAIVVFTKHAGKVVETVKLVVTTVESVFRSFALSINFAPGKTEALVGLRGTGSKQVKLQLSKNMTSDGTYLLPSTCSNNVNIDLRIVHS